MLRPQCVAMLPKPELYIPGNPGLRLAAPTDGPPADGWATGGDGRTRSDGWMHCAAQDRGTRFCGDTWTVRRRRALWRGAKKSLEVVTPAEVQPGLIRVWPPAECLRSPVPGVAAVRTASESVGKFLQSSPRAHTGRPLTPDRHRVRATGDCPTRMAPGRTNQSLRDSGWSSGSSARLLRRRSRG